MTKKLLFGLLLVISIKTFAQEKKWSIETNYAVIPSDGFGGKDNVIDLGIKYRFAEFNILKLGFGVNAGFSRDKMEDAITTISDSKSYFIQPRAFAEFHIPGAERFRPNIGLGYSIVNTDFESNVLTTNDSNGGFNFNAGLTYDITNSFFVQAQYDFINLKRKDDFIINGEAIRVDQVEKLNNFKIGVGFRF